MARDPYFLAHGAHQTPDQGRCVMELAAYLAGEAHSDTPTCVSPLVRRFCAGLNDAFDNDKRQRLRLYVGRTLGTRDDGLDDKRGWLATDWLVRTYLPTWLDHAPRQQAKASQLRALSPITSTAELALVWRAMGDLRQWIDTYATMVTYVMAMAQERVTFESRFLLHRLAGGSAADSVVRQAAINDKARWDDVKAVAFITIGVVGVAYDPSSTAVVRLQDSALDLLDAMLPTMPLVIPAVTIPEYTTV